MHMRDEDLARLAANGDADAFGRLLERHYDRLFALCFRLTGGRADAEDLCQDICAALPGKLRGFRGEAKVTTWLYRVAVNAAHDRRRRNHSQARARKGWGNWHIDRTAEAEEDTRRLAWLHEAMAALKPDLRDTLALIFDDLTHAEAAEVLGVSEGTISWRVSEAKRALAALRAEEEAT